MSGKSINMRDLRAISKTGMGKLREERELAGERERK